MDDLISSFIEVKLKNNESFLPIVETLTRVGVASKNEKKLTQSCHLLHKRGKYYILSFKECMMLDGLTTTFSDEDKQRRNKIASLLQEWGLLEIIDPEKIKDQIDISKIKIISFKEKSDWLLASKYMVGKRK